MLFVIYNQSDIRTVQNDIVYEEIRFVYVSFWRHKKGSAQGRKRKKSLSDGVHSIPLATLRVTAKSKGHSANLIVLLKKHRRCAVTVILPGNLFRFYDF